jgi:hypothetical protein
MNKVVSIKTYPFWKLFTLIAFVFSPKIDIISIPNFWQGIRLDDLIILFYSILFFFSNKSKIYPNLINSKIFGFNWIIFFPYLVFSMIIGKLFQIEPSFIILIRYMEYIALIIILNQLDYPKEAILSCFKVYILINFVIVLLQYFDLVGGFTSRGMYHLADIKEICLLNCDLGFWKNYIPAGEFLSDRVTGISGGPWELSMNLSLSLFSLALFEKKIKKIAPYFLMTILIMMIVQSRGIVFGFVAGSLFIFNDLKKSIIIIFFLLIFIILIYLINIFNFREIINERFFVNYFELIKIIISAFTGNLTQASIYENTGLESMWWRAYHWQQALSDVKKSSIMIIFGNGGHHIYVESFIIRLITSFGIVGSLLTIYLSRKLPLFFIVFIFVTGITIDMFISFKIFVFSCLFLILYKKNKNVVN